MRRIITLLTDFGTADGYVAEMKGVLASGAPEATLLDLSHDVPSQDVDAARLVIARCWRRFPERTVHLVVVDPGVGSDRAALVVESDGRLLVGPDNGVLSPALLMPGARVTALPIPSGASATFHGRDVFAPAAARLAVGASPEELGAPFAEPIVRRTPVARRLADGATEGEVLTIDRFGNVITNLVAPRGGFVEAAGRVLAIRRSYADVPSGELTAVVGSTGFVEIALRDGDAASVLRLERGMPVILRLAHA